MGFTTGFSGGVALTLTVTYLTLLTHQRNREQQGAALRAQALQLQGIVDPLPGTLPPTRAQLAAAERSASFEVAKDRWNHEVEKAVRWAQHTDWNDVRENLEDGVGNLWGVITGSTPAAGGNDAASSSSRKAPDSSGIASAARDAYGKSRSRTLSVEEAAENKMLEARLRTVHEVGRAGDVVEHKAGQVKAGLASAWENGKEKAKDLAEKAKTVVMPAVGYGGGDKAGVESAVEKALRQRYERVDVVMGEKTVAEALRERYTPMNQVNHTNLRGL